MGQIDSQQLVKSKRPHTYLEEQREIMSHQANVATLGENLQELQVVFYHVNVSIFDLKEEEKSLFSQIA